MDEPPSQLIHGNFKTLGQNDNIDKQSMKYETLRLSSFVNFPESCPVSALQLSKAGFFYSGSDDEVQCYSCGVNIKDWIGKGEPWGLHKKISPQCQFVTCKNENISMCESSLNPCWFEKLHKQTPKSNGSNRKEFDQVDSKEMHFLNIKPTEDELPRSTPGGSLKPLQTDSGQHPSTSLSALNDVFQHSTHHISINYKDESNRQQSFREWPVNSVVLPADLAKSGFYYTGTDDRVQCVFCKGVLSHWEQGDVPDIEHRNHFVQCPFILNPDAVGNIKLEDKSNNHQTSTMNDSSIRQAITTDKPVHQSLSLPSERLATFKGCPTNMAQAPEQFTRAGFFYAGLSDHVKCFFCDGGLRNWEPNDDPWTEHARWFPRCDYLRLCKGDKFIENIQERYFPKNVSSKTKRFTNKDKKQAVDGEKLKEFMEGQIVASVLDMGYNKDTIKEVITFRMKDFGDAFYPNAESLLDDLVDFEDEYRLKESKNNTVQSQLPSKEHLTEIAKQLADEKQKLEDKMQCKICMDESANTVFLPCGHLVCCSSCAPALRHCPICRVLIRGTTKVYMS